MNGEPSALTAQSNFWLPGTTYTIYRGEHEGEDWLGLSFRHDHEADEYGTCWRTARTEDIISVIEQALTATLVGDAFCTDLRYPTGFRRPGHSSQLLGGQWDREDAVELRGLEGDLAGGTQGWGLGGHAHIWKSHWPSVKSALRETLAPICASGTVADALCAPRTARA